MDRRALVRFVRDRGLAVVATVSRDGEPQAAVVGVAATDDGDLVFDTTRTSRKFANLSERKRVALVIGFDWNDEQTVQLEGAAIEVPQDSPAVAAYYAQFPSGRDRAAWPEIVYVCVRPDWGRYSDYRPESFGTHDIVLAPSPEPLASRTSPGRPRMVCARSESTCGRPGCAAARDMGGDRVDQGASSITWSLVW